MDVVRRHILYTAPIPTTPSVLLIEVPEANRGPGLALGRYYPVVIESDSEQGEIIRFLHNDDRACAIPHMLDRRPSALQTDVILVVHYEPPAPGWPWFSLACWPDDLGRLAASQNVGLARNRYSMEAFATEAALGEHHRQMVDLLRTHHPIEVALIASEGLQPGGQV